MLQTILLISLFILEIFAFGWLIWEAKLGREKREQIIRTRVLLDFRFHPSLQSVVERFQKRRAVNVSSRGVRRRRRQRRDRRRARDRFLQRAAAFFATTIPPPVCCFCHDDGD